MHAVDWKGIFPALTTKFTEDDKLDLVLFRKNVEAQLRAGVHGLIIGGSLGEASTLQESEKRAMIEVALEEAAGRVPVVLNIAEGSTSEAIRLAVIAERWGVGGLMLLPPMRYRPDERELIQYFAAVAGSSPLPIMIYNNPVDYRTEVTLRGFDELARIDSIQAVKESTRDVSNVTRMINRFGDRFRILCGVDTLALEAFMLGAHGWVAGLVNAFPDETVALYQFAKEGRMEEAVALYRWFLPLLELDLHPKLVQYIKLAESIMGLGSEFVRAPRLVLEGQERQQVVDLVQRQLSARSVTEEISPLQLGAIAEKYQG